MATSSPSCAVVRGLQSTAPSPLLLFPFLLTRAQGVNPTWRLPLHLVQLREVCGLLPRVRSFFFPLPPKRAQGDNPIWQLPLYLARVCGLSHPVCRESTVAASPCRCRLGPLSLVVVFWIGMTMGLWWFSIWIQLFRLMIFDKCLNLLEP